jgi:formamidopyrimidine-DNA glycosylase
LCREGYASGIGNAYSDEILHAAQLSPLVLTEKLEALEWDRLFAATRQTVRFWIDRLGAEARIAFPEKVTAFRPCMAVHGRYGQPCPRCGDKVLRIRYADKVLRIRYADKETNYCAPCQTGGKPEHSDTAFVLEIFARFLRQRGRVLEAVLLRLKRDKFGVTSKWIK